MTFNFKMGNIITEKEGFIMAYIEFKNVSKEYENGNVLEKALKKVSFKIEDGEIVVITGPSVSGRKAIFNILSGASKPTCGEVLIDGLKINDLKGKNLTKYKRECVGLVFEKDNLIENLTAEENICIYPSKNDLDWLLKKLNIGGKKDNFPSQLSKKDEQKVAIARAFYKNPKFILCDEPVGLLGFKESKQILKLIKEIAKKEKKTIIIITNNSDISPIANKVIKIKDGLLESTLINKTPLDAGDLKW